MPNESVRSYLSRGNLPESVMIINWHESQVLGEKVSSENGEPPGRDALIIKFDRRTWFLVGLALAFFVLCAGMLGWDLEHNQAYAGGRPMTLPIVVLAAISGITFYAILHAGFSYLWLIVEESGLRFRARRFIRYRTESLPFASIDEIAVEIYPRSKRRELARLVIVRGERRVELFRGQVAAAEDGFIAWTAGLLNAASGLPVTRRKYQG